MADISKNIIMSVAHMRTAHPHGIDAVRGCLVLAPSGHYLLTRWPKWADHAGVGPSIHTGVVCVSSSSVTPPPSPPHRTVLPSPTANRDKVVVT